MLGQGCLLLTEIVPEKNDYRATHKEADIKTNLRIKLCLLITPACVSQGTLYNGPRFMYIKTLSCCIHKYLYPEIKALGNVH